MLVSNKYYCAIARLFENKQRIHCQNGVKTDQAPVQEPFKQPVGEKRANLVDDQPGSYQAMWYAATQRSPWHPVQISVLPMVYRIPNRSKLVVYFDPTRSVAKRAQFRTVPARGQLARSPNSLDPWQPSGVANQWQSRSNPWPIRFNPSWSVESSGIWQNGSVKKLYLPIRPSPSRVVFSDPVQGMIQACIQKILFNP